MTATKEPITFEIAFNEAYQWTKRPVLAIEGYEVRLGEPVARTQTFAEYIDEKYDISLLNNPWAFLQEKDPVAAYDILVDQLELSNED